MNYINKDKNYMTDKERIRYLEESIRELRNEKENLKKEKGRLKAENRELKETNMDLNSALMVSSAEIVRLKKELSLFDRVYFDEDKKYGNMLMEEDTLQELRDLGEI